MPLISRKIIKGVHITMKPKTSAAMLRIARPAAHQRPSLQAAFFAGPGDQRFRLGGDALAFTAYGKIFPKIEPRLQFGNRRLPLLDFLNIGMIQQPASQALLAHVGACRREQLEEAAFAQNVQVFRVQMQWVLEFFTRFTASGPAIFHPRKTAAINGNRAFRHIERSHYAPVCDDEGHEYSDGR